MTLKKHQAEIKRVMTRPRDDSRSGNSAMKPKIYQLKEMKTANTY